MIKKILSTLLVSSVLFVFAITSSYAERPNFAIGLQGAYGAGTATGSELEGAGSPQEKTVAERSGEFGWTNIFLEVQDIGDRLTLGASWSADDFETDQEARTDSLCSAQPKNAQGNIISTCPVVGNTGTSTVSVEFSNMVTAYAELRLYEGFYVKAGMIEVDVTTKESLHTDTEYPNTTLDGDIIGFGWRGSWDNGVFLKTETQMTSFSGVTLQGSGKTGTDNNTSVTLDNLDAVTASISIGKAF
tara:strand:+ start:197 stop:931 length:735 start_codon:yes stop_codon:yes gene_type:complete